MSNKIRSRQYADAKGVIAEGFDGNAILAEGATVPTDATAGYAPGCVFFKRAGGTFGGHYVNDGTAASCDFNLISTGGVSLAALTATAAELNTIASGVLATAAEVNRSSKLSTREVAVGAANLTVTLALHDGKTILLDTATGIAVTLPAMTGSGARYRFACNVATAGGSHVITATGAHLFGSLTMNDDTGVGTLFTERCATAQGSTVITLDGSTKGGRKGDWFEIEDVATSVGVVRGHLNASGTEATPFS